jgi:hypothetical protein
VRALEDVQHTRRDTFRRQCWGGATRIQIAEIRTDLLTLNLLAEVVAKQSRKD